MPIPEPSGSSAGLWSEVRPQVQWPQADEDMVSKLGLAWTNAGAAFFVYGGKSYPTLNTAWPDDDDNGKNYKALVATLTQDAKSAATSMDRLGYLATEFAADVTHTKDQITKLVDANALMYQLATIPGWWGDYSFQHDIANDVANKINVFLRQMAARIEARNAGAPETEPPILHEEGRGGGFSLSDIPLPLGRGRGPRRPNDRGPRPGPANAASYARYLEQLKVAELANPLLESLRLTGRLPPNFHTKLDAAANGWAPGKALNNYIRGGQIGGDVYQNTTGLVPSAPGRIWYEADVGLNNTMSRGKQPGYRLVYSNDGLAYVTTDHYSSFFKLPNWK